MSARRQTDLSPGACSHAKTEPVENHGGKVIAYRCATCTIVLCHYGDCDGCGAERKLTVHVRSTGERFCTPDCKSETRRAERLATKAVAS